MGKALQECIFLAPPPLPPSDILSGGPVPKADQKRSEDEIRLRKKIAMNQKHSLIPGQNLKDGTVPRYGAKLPFCNRSTKVSSVDSKSKSRVSSSVCRKIWEKSGNNLVRSHELLATLEGSGRALRGERMLEGPGRSGKLIGDKYFLAVATSETDRKYRSFSKLLCIKVFMFANRNTQERNGQWVFHYDWFDTKFCKYTIEDHWLLVKIFRRFKFRINTQAQPNYPTVTWVWSQMASL